MAALPSPGVPSPWRCANSWELSSATGHTQSDICQMDGGTFCVDWWRGFHCLRLVDELKQGWASPPILCRVDGDAMRDPDKRTMHLLFKLDLPVAVPHPPLPPPPALPPLPPAPALPVSQACTL